MYEIKRFDLELTIHFFRSILHVCDEIINFSRELVNRIMTDFGRMNRKKRIAQKYCSCLLELAVVLYSLEKVDLTDFYCAF